MRTVRGKRLKSRQFASPKGQAPNKSKDQYPVDTRGRAISAKGRATQMRKKGKLSRSKEQQIKAKANRALKRMGKKKKRR